MQRLRSRAFEILSTEVNQYGQEDFVSEVGRKIVMQRLEKLRSQPGDPLSFDELREVVTDQFPDFNEDILRRTAQINCPVKATPWVLWGSMTLLTVCGAVWIANLPFALIREPVTRYASILLLPTHIKTDRDYQQAMALLNQVEQQLQQPEPDPKLDSMEQRLQETSQLLNDLPKSALGSYPKLYCAVTRCDWTFTPQEYQVIESKLEQLQARVLQEQQAQTQLQQAQTGLTSAQKQYQDSTSNTTRSQAIVDWQQALDQLQKIPPGTRAGQTAQQLHPVAQQTFQTTLNTTSQTQNINALILVAQQYALKASTLAQNPPHPEAKWQQAIAFWKEAIIQLERVSSDSPGYSAAQTKLREYQANLNDLEVRLQEELNAVKTVKTAEQMIAEWRELARSKDPNIRTLRRKLNQITDTLENIEAGTTVTDKAQDLLRAARYTQSQL